MSRIFQSDILDSSHHWPIGRNEEWLTCLFRTARPKKVLPIVKKHRVLQQFETFRSKQHGTCGVSFVLFPGGRIAKHIDFITVLCLHSAWGHQAGLWTKCLNYIFQGVLDTYFNKTLLFGDSHIFGTTQPKVWILTIFCFSSKKHIYNVLRERNTASTNKSSFAACCANKMGSGEPLYLQKSTFFSTPIQGVWNFVEKALSKYAAHHQRKCGLKLWHEYASFPAGAGGVTTVLLQIRWPQQYRGTMGPRRKHTIHGISVYTVQKAKKHRKAVKWPPGKKFSVVSRAPTTQNCLEPLATAQTAALFARFKDVREHMPLSSARKLVDDIEHHRTILTIKSISIAIIGALTRLWRKWLDSSTLARYPRYLCFRLSTNNMDMESACCENMPGGVDRCHSFSSYSKIWIPRTNYNVNHFNCFTKLSSRQHCIE